MAVKLKAQPKPTPMPVDARYFTVSEAAEYLRVRRWTVAAAIREKTLPYVHLGKKYILLREDLDAFATANRVAA
ncbi:MAG: helix-turn-helix domain-containing protein [Candidatus Acidiferrales bacterium]